LTSPSGLDRDAGQGLTEAVRISHLDVLLDAERAFPASGDLLKAGQARVAKSTRAPLLFGFELIKRGAQCQIEQRHLVEL